MKTFMDQIKDILGDNFEDVFNPNEIYDVIPTGSYSLDVSLGVGGIPKKRITLLYGAESSGKSTLALMIAKNAIEKGNRVLYIDMEQQMSDAYINAIIGEHERDQLILAQPLDSDQAFNIAELGVMSKEFGLIVLDSIASLAPPEEKKKDFDEGNMMVIPRDLAKFFRRQAGNIRVNNVAVVLINQVRDKIGSYVPTFEIPGGHAIKHYSSIIVQLSKSSDIKNGDQVVGAEVKFVVKKNKLAPPMRSFHFPLIFGKGVDSTRDLLEFAVFLGIVRRAGAYYKFEEQTIGRGMVDSAEVLNTDKLLLDKIINRCYTVIGVNQTLEEKEEDHGNFG